MVFISYAREDGDFVSRLESGFRNANIECWRDTGRIKTGDGVPSKIAAQIEKCTWFVAVLSENYVRKPFCQTELEMVWMREQREQKTIILPILADNCKVPFLIRHKAWTDMSGANFPNELPGLLSKITDPAGPGPLFDPEPDPGIGASLPNVEDAKLLLDRSIESKPLRMLLRTHLASERRPVAAIVKGFQEDDFDRFMERLVEVDAEWILNKTGGASGKPLGVPLYWPNEHACDARGLDALWMQVEQSLIEGVEPDASNETDVHNAVSHFSVVVAYCDVLVDCWNPVRAQLLDRLCKYWSRFPVGADQPVCLLLVNASIAKVRPKWSFLGMGQPPSMPKELQEAPFAHNELFPHKVPIELNLVESFYVKQWLSKVKRNPTPPLDEMIQNFESWPMRKVQAALP